MQIAYDAENIAEAHIVAAMLRAENIEAHVGGHYLQGAIGETAAGGFANVLVEDESFIQARILVERYERSGNVEAPPADIASKTAATKFSDPKLFFALLSMVALVGFVTLGGL